jgi:flagellar biosynthesis/type III secretory pathway M-ring protein FliF/YscJ
LNLFRLVDPSGNRDIAYSTATNAYTWLYVEPLPWGKIISFIFLIIALIIISIIEYRRREQKAALERYAQRRTRRKFKLHAMQESNDQWKDIFEEQAHQKGTEDKDNSHDHEQRKDRRRQRRKRRENLLEYDSEDDDRVKALHTRRRPKSKLR